MTQKELGIAVGFDEKSADIRIAQYESNTRTPKEDLLRKLAEALDVNYRSLYEPTLYAAEDIMYTLFELDEHYPGTKLYEVTDADSSSSHMAVSLITGSWMSSCGMAAAEKGVASRSDHQRGVSRVEAQLAPNF